MVWPKVLSPDLEILAVTQDYLDATMTRRSAITGRGLFEVFPDNPDDAEATGESNLRASLERVVSTRQPDTMPVQKYDVRRPDAEGGDFVERFWSPRNLPVLGAGGEVRYIIHRVEDVTEFVRLQHAGEQQRRATDDLRNRAARMEAEVLARSQELHDANQQLRTSKAQLEAANRELEQRAGRLRETDALKSQFLAMASHELRTPLTAITGFTSTMLNRWSQFGDDEKLSFLEIIDAQSHRLNRLVEDLLTLSKVESGKLRVDADVIDVALEVKRILRDMGGDKQMLVRSEDGVNAIADRTHVNQILTNFITNAHKYGRGPFEVQVARKGRWVEICVSDHGDGVPPEFVPHLFETFARAEPNQSSTDGTGLGLAITRALAQAQGGAAWYEPGETCGARFKATLPAADTRELAHA